MDVSKVCPLLSLELEPSPKDREGMVKDKEGGCSFLYPSDCS